jgi:RimJ/RimL family protein N-acetyltransferase
VVGDGLILREWTEADLTAMCELFDEPSIDHWTPLESPFDLGAARRYLARSIERRLAGSALQLAITEDGATPLGEVLLFDHGGWIAELGYTVGVRHRGRALAARAVELVLQRATREWGFRRFRLRIEPTNEVSVRVAVRCGFLRTAGPPLSVSSKGRQIEVAVWERRVFPAEHTPGEPGVRYGLE